MGLQGGKSEVNVETETGGNEKAEKKYGQASKTGKGEIIVWLVVVAGYNRKYAATLLRSGQKKKKQTKPEPKSGRPPI